SVVTLLRQPRLPLFPCTSLFRSRRTDPVVVRPQRSRLLPDHRLSRHDVLLRPQASRASDLFLPPVHRAFLGTDHPLHLGWPAPLDRKSTRLNSSHVKISYAVLCL